MTMEGFTARTDPTAAAPAERADAGGGAIGRLADLLRLARPWHWIKNGLIFAPVPFALFDKTQTVVFDATAFAWGLLGFSLIASAIYVFNDLIDAQADRLHPRKCGRPLAAARVSPAAATVWMLLLLVGGFAATAAVGRAAALWLAALYAGINALYCLGAKHVPVLDVLMVTSGFVIRVVFGCALVNVAPSPWLLACTCALALFLAFGKRRADLVAGVPAEHRPALRGYSPGFLTAAMALAGLAAAAAYTFYTFDSHVFLNGRRLAGVPFVAFGIGNYMRLSLGRGIGGAPEEWILTAWSTQACVLGWAAATAWSAGLW
jgi:4-hydroxybenzoate polyprenyltransferase